MSKVKPIKHTKPNNNAGKLNHEEI